MATQQPTPPPGRVLTIAEFCTRASISRRFFYVLRERGEAPATITIGRKRGVLEATAVAWLQARES